MAKPLTKFRVYYEEGERLFCEVWIWQWLKDMRSHNIDLQRKMAGGGGSFLRDAHGITAIIPGRRQKVAEIHLAKGHLTPDIINHEVLHACLGWANRLGLSIQAESTAADEERLCYAVGKVSGEVGAGVSAYSLCL